MLIRACDNNCYINKKQIKFVCEASKHLFDKPIYAHKNINTTSVFIFFSSLLKQQRYGIMSLQDSFN